MQLSATRVIPYRASVIVSSSCLIPPCICCSAAGSKRFGSMTGLAPSAILYLPKIPKYEILLILILAQKIGNEVKLFNSHRKYCSKILRLNSIYFNQNISTVPNRDRRRFDRSPGPWIAMYIQADGSVMTFYFYNKYCKRKQLVSTYWRPKQTFPLNLHNDLKTLNIFSFLKSLKYGLDLNWRQMFYEETNSVTMF